MMKYFSFFLVAAVVFISSCCKPEEQGNFTVQLNAFVGAQPLSFTNTIYTDSVAKEFFFSKLKFYVSHVKLIKADNSEVEIKDAAFLDYSDRNWKSFTAKADAGTYKGIKFSVGLDASQNQTDPDNYSGNEPLGPKDDMYWDWLKHRFIVLEGTADTLGNGFNGGTKGLGYHVGTDVCYRTITLMGQNNFTVENDASKQINLNLDLLKIFKGSPDVIDMFQQPATQSEVGDIDIAEKFANLFATAFTYSE